MNTTQTRVDTYDPAVINNHILTLWDEHFTSTKHVRTPYLYGSLAKHALVYVGMNPSFSVPAIERIAQGTEYEGIDVNTFFDWDTVRSDRSHTKDVVRFEQYAAEKYSSYFRPMYDLARVAGLQPQSVETFLYRCTSQKEFTELILSNRTLNDFGRKQIQLLREVLTCIQPTVIVVANAMASRILRKEFENELVFSEDHGFHTLLIQGKRTPIFFSSMLTGQRALDLGSYERLKWHVGKAAKFGVS